MGKPPFLSPKANPKFATKPSRGTLVLSSALAGVPPFFSFFSPPMGAAQHLYSPLPLWQPFFLVGAFTPISWFAHPRTIPWFGAGFVNLCWFYGYRWVRIPSYGLIFQVGNILLDRIVATLLYLARSWRLRFAWLADLANLTEAIKSQVKMNQPVEMSRWVDSIFGLL